VHEGTEVKLTGRQAIKEKTRAVTKRITNETVDTIHEITPLDNEIGSWKKWVKMNELFEIVI
jgi:hypothetical protein